VTFSPVVPNPTSLLCFITLEVFPVRGLRELTPLEPVGEHFRAIVFASLACEVLQVARVIAIANITLLILGIPVLAFRVDADALLNTTKGIDLFTLLFLFIIDVIVHHFIDVMILIKIVPNEEILLISFEKFSPDWFNTSILPVLKVIQLIITV
jgi:hypothetical protein